MTEAWTFPNPQKAVTDLLDSLTPGTDSDRSVGELPEQWTAASPLHLQVAWDGTLIKRRILADATVRVCAWAHGAGIAADAALAAQGRLLAHDGTGPISSVRPGVGPLPARDPAHAQADLAWFTVLVTFRAVPLT